MAQAQINLDVAQQALDDLLNWEADADQIAQLEANLVAAAGGLTMRHGGKKRQLAASKLR